jgi:hypothetical protein
MAADRDIFAGLKPVPMHDHDDIDVRIERQDRRIAHEAIHHAGSAGFRRCDLTAALGCTHTEARRIAVAVGASLNKQNRWVLPPDAVFVEPLVAGRRNDE